MTWIQTPPTEPGWYWIDVREFDNDPPKPDVVRFDVDGDEMDAWVCGWDVAYWTRPDETRAWHSGGCVRAWWSEDGITPTKIAVPQ